MRLGLSWCLVEPRARAALAAGLVAWLAACGPTGGVNPPRDPEADALFAALAVAEDPLTAHGLEQQIWGRWSSSGSATVDILLERAAAAEAAGETQLAEEFLIQACELAPHLAEPWSRRAAIAYGANDYSAAIAAIEETLRREPRHFGALAGLGAIYEELGQERAALSAYREALLLHPFLEAARQGVARLSAKLEGRDA